MQDTAEKIYRNFTEFFSGLDANRKAGLVGISLFIAAGLFVIVFWASGTRYEVLYKDLNREDSKKVAVMLEEGKIEYKLSNDGKKIEIPEDKVKEWRLKLAMRGVSFSGAVGYEVFDKQAFGTTSFVQKVNRQRALEGELIKTIKYISGIKRARVHLSIPEQSPFVSEKKPPSASVVLDLEDGVTLTPAEIKGIGFLVSSAVNEMRPQQVVILDGRGKKLSDNVGDPMTAHTANRMALESKMNNQYEKQIEDILGKVVGNGKVIAKVTVNLDFTQSVSTQTRYDQEGAAVLSEVKNSQKI
ncbi:MAG: flagellar M-ring protein FliF, partial [Halobacteriovoraceae bacterium]|nr:flagellar M-ring protein FliF [Halobacteriovoraceae bacterium]